MLALQGNYAVHLALLETLGCAACPVRQHAELRACRALIIPGGESSVMGALLQRSGLLAPLERAVRRGLPIFGVCAGAILLAQRIQHSDQPRLGTMDIEVARNAYGRQIESHLSTVRLDPAFIKQLNASRRHSTPILSDVPGLFIRAPRICAWGEAVHPLAYIDSEPVAAQQEAMLMTAFHPEMTDITLFHAYFCDTIAHDKRLDSVDFFD